MAEIEILPASPADHADISQIALAAKGYWGYPQAWLTSWDDQLRIPPEVIEKDLVYKAQVHGETVAFYALTSQAGNKMAFNHLWVKPEWIGHGIGSLLFQHALHQAAASGASLVEIESDPNALGFYLKMGAKQVGTRASNMDRKLPLLIMEVGHAGI